VASIIVPGGGMLAMIPELVTSVQATFPSGTGAQKKEVVLKTVLATLQITEGISQRDFLNDEEFMDAVDDYIEAQVKLMKLFKKKKDATSVPLPTPAPVPTPAPKP
jgi:hypothetical protein